MHGKFDEGKKLGGMKNDQQNHAWKHTQSIYSSSILYPRGQEIAMKKILHIFTLSCSKYKVLPSHAKNSEMEQLSGYQRLEPTKNGDGKVNSVCLQFSLYCRNI